VEITMTVPGAIEVIGAAGHDRRLSSLESVQVPYSMLKPRSVVSMPVRSSSSVRALTQTLLSSQPAWETHHGRCADPTEVIAAWKAGSDFVKNLSLWFGGRCQLHQGLEGAFAASPHGSHRRINLNTAADFIRAGLSCLVSEGNWFPPPPSNRATQARLHRPRKATSPLFVTLGERQRHSLEAPRTSPGKRPRGVSASQ